MIKRQILFVVCCVIAHAQSWDQVRAVPAGAQLRLVTDNVAALRGQLQLVSDTELILRSPAPQTLLRPQILRVDIKKQGHRLRNTFIGLGVGLGAGLVAGAIDASRCKGLLCGLAVPVYGAIGLVGGTAAGALWPTGGWRTIYRR